MFTKIVWCYPVLHGASFQVAQIYKDASVGNPVSVAVVKVEILQVRRATEYFVTILKTYAETRNYNVRFSRVIFSDQAAIQTANSGLRTARRKIRRALKCADCLTKIVT